MIKIVNVNVGFASKRDSWPTTLNLPAGRIQDPTPEQCAAVGWHVIAEIIPAPEGMVASAWVYEIIMRDEPYDVTVQIPNPDYIAAVGNVFIEVEGDYPNPFYVPATDESPAIGEPTVHETRIVENPEYVPAIGEPELSVVEQRTRSVDSLTCRETCTAWFDPVEEERKRKEAEEAARAAALAEKIANMPLAIKYEHAPTFRRILRLHFGPDAETNADISEAYIYMFFKAKRDAGTITAQDDADVLILKTAFAACNEWWGTGETWSFPWVEIL